MNIIIIEKNKIMKEGLIKMIVREYPDIHLISIPEMNQLNNTLKTCRVELVIIPLSSCSIAKIDQIKEMLAVSPYPVRSIAILHKQDYIMYLEDLMKTGINGYVSFEATENELIPAIKKVIQKNKYYFSKDHA